MYYRKFIVPHIIGVYRSYYHIFIKLENLFVDGNIGQLIRRFIDVIKFYAHISLRFSNASNISKWIMIHVLMKAKSIRSFFCLKKTFMQSVISHLFCIYFIFSEIYLQNIIVKTYISYFMKLNLFLLQLLQKDQNPEKIVVQREIRKDIS